MSSAYIFASLLVPVGVVFVNQAQAAAPYLASDVLGQGDFSSTVQNYNSNPTFTGLDRPQDTALDTVNHRLYIADRNNNRVLIYNLNNSNQLLDNLADYVLGQANFTSSGSDNNAQGFYRPEGLTINPTTNQLFVADSGNHRVLVFDINSLSNNMSASYVLGQADFISGGIDTNAQGFFQPVGVTINPTTNQLFVADNRNHRVLVFDINSLSNNMSASYVLGQADFTKGEAGGGANSYGLNYDGTSPTLDLVHHRLFVSDTYNCRVLVFNLDNSNNLVDKTADSVIGQADLISTDCSNTENRLDQPGGTAYDSKNDLLFVSDMRQGCRVMVYDVASISNGENAAYILGGTDKSSSGDCGTTQSSLGSTLWYGDVAYDEKTKRLYVTDTHQNARIMIFDLSNGISNGMNASWVIGSNDFNTPGLGDVSSTGFGDSYTNIEIDPDTQKLFVSLYYQSRVLVFDVATISNGEPAVAVLGQADFTSQDTLTTQQGGGGPVGLGLDTEGHRLFVADYDNSRILVYDVNNPQTGDNAIAVLGQPDFTSSGSGTSQSSIYLWSQANMAYDPVNNRLYFGDDNNARILIFDFANINLGTGDPNTKFDLPDAQFGKPYDYALPITGTQGTVTCTLESGTLPVNVVITPDCHVKGTPGSNTPYTFTVKVTDDNGTIGTFSDSQVLGLTVNHASSSGSGGSGSGGSNTNGDNSGNLANTGEGMSRQVIGGIIYFIFAVTIISGAFLLTRQNRAVKVDPKQ